MNNKLILTLAIIAAFFCSFVVKGMLVAQTPPPTGNSCVAEPYGHIQQNSTSETSTTMCIDCIENDIPIYENGQLIGFRTERVQKIVMVPVTTKCKPGGSFSCTVQSAPMGHSGACVSDGTDAPDTGTGTGEPDTGCNQGTSQNHADSPSYPPHQPHFRCPQHPDCQYGTL